MEAQKSSIKRKIKIPIVFRFLRWGFPRLEKISPSMARTLATHLFFRPVKFPYPLPEKEALKKAQSKFIRVDRKKVKTYFWGEGKPVILVHGWSGRATQFWKFIDVFNKNGFQVISFDAPAHGYSPGSSTSELEFADVIIKLTELYNPHVVIGHSLGGVASLLAITEGAKIDNILMISSPSIGADIIAEFLKKLNASPSSGLGIEHFVKKITDKPFEDFLSLSLIKKANGINLHLVHDIDDSEVPIAHAEALCKAYPAATLHKTKGLGHTRILRNEEVIEKCLNFAMYNN
ncbi:MAG: alpha/beta hydrolase [Cyclobacteriaceae bacterium]|nr:alpha/beta hydrolase [Cyclobacteriaceae bacterium]